MALTYRFYRTTEIGTGTTTDPFRSALADFIVEDGTGATFHDLLGLGGFRYCLARCEAALHPTIEADARIVPLGADFANAAAVKTFLDRDPTTLSAGVQARLIADGFPLKSTIRKTIAPVLRAVKPLLPAGS